MSSPVSPFLGQAPPRLLVAGDLMLDRYVWGDVDRISPEAPVQVLRWRAENEALGGAANVAHNLAALGCEARLLGIVGEDAEGDRFLALAREAGIDIRFVRRIAGRPTISKTRLLARSQHVLRVDKEADSFPSGALEGVGGVICSDYLKGVLTPRFTQTLLAQAKGLRLSAVVDPKGRDYAKYRGARALTPNLAEVALASGLPVDSEENLGRATRKLLEETRAELVLVTRGAGGMTLFGREGLLSHEPARALEVYDVTGAGDTAAALFGLALFGGLPPAEAARLANLGAGIAV
ncbi:MAG: bifunctional hydroxymethylpyrimidine kinase/phosphomethylpyrimidine kinase, partial [Candidatus Tectomicrobia bacterium]|nr:bifunctional hydroxymethylpyrimidine kinase/phosphomethylpyrimidine kinase [Candidatus Tectomicrobia bacterium]